MAKKNPKWGGYRKGGGRPKTGRNTVAISFSVHKDFKKIIKEMVFAKVKELKAKQNGSAPKPVAKKFVYLDTKDNKIKESNAPIAATLKINKKALGSDYMTKRRNAKLGL